MKSCCNHLVVEFGYTHTHTHGDFFKTIYDDYPRVYLK